MNELASVEVAENDFLIISPALQKSFQVSLWNQYETSGYLSVKVLSNILVDYAPYSILSEEQWETITEKDLLELEVNYLSLVEQDVATVLWKWNCFHMYDEHNQLPIFYGPPLHPPVKEVW